MNFGFDLEGTLDADPHVFSALCHALVTAGHGVHIITAYWSPDGGFDQSQVDLRKSQIAAIGFELGVHYSAVIYAPGFTAEQQAEQKSQACASWGIALMFEDRQDFCDEISKVTRCVLMQPRL